MPNYFDTNKVDKVISIEHRVLSIIQYLLYFPPWIPVALTCGIIKLLTCIYWRQTLPVSVIFFIIFLCHLASKLK